MPSNQLRYYRLYDLHTPCIGILAASKFSPIGFFGGLRIYVTGQCFLFLWETFEQIRLSENGSLTYLWPQAQNIIRLAALAGSILSTYLAVLDQWKRKT